MMSDTTHQYKLGDIYKSKSINMGVGTNYNIPTTTHLQISRESDEKYINKYG